METKEEKIVIPSLYGSHAIMIDKDLTQKLACVNENDSEVVLLDNRGHYRTSKDRLDTGLADPNRNFDREKSAKELSELLGTQIVFSSAKSEE